MRLGDIPVDTRIVAHSPNVALDDDGVLALGEDRFRDRIRIGHVG